MGPHQGSVEGKENLPRPAGPTLLDAPQDPIGFLGSQGTLLAYGPSVSLNVESLTPNAVSPQPPSCAEEWAAASVRMGFSRVVTNAELAAIPVEPGDTGSSGGRSLHAGHSGSCGTEMAK